MTKTIDINAASQALGTQFSRYLCFTLGDEEYAIPLLSVKEVIAVPEITPVPQTPPYFMGIMNLRGQVISILDLRSKLGIKPAPSAETAVIICDLGQMVIGVIVDSINSVLAPKEGEIAPRPDLQHSKTGDYVTGVYRHHQKLVLFLEIAKILNAEDKNTATRSVAKKAA